MAAVETGEIEFGWYVAKPRRRSVSRPRQDDVERKARFFERPPEVDVSSPKRKRDSERAYYVWQHTPIPKAVKNTELVGWLWQDGQRVCPLCEREIDIELTTRNHPGKPELDHIQAKAWGGEHVWGNVRVVHGTCNRLRGGHDGIGLDYTPKQYRRVFDRAVEHHSMPDRGQAKSRMRISGMVDSSLRRVEWFEEMLGWFGDPEAEARMSDYFREGGPDRVREAIAYNRKEMERYQEWLTALDWVIVGTNARRALREARERREAQP